MEAEGKIDSLIGKETVIKGDIKTNGSAKIDGSVEGSILVKDSVFIGKGASVKGNVNCKNGVIGGKIEGNIDAQEMIEFQNGAQMFGDIVCKGLIIQEGVFFEGNCRMSQKVKEAKEKT